MSDATASQREDMSSTFDDPVGRLIDEVAEIILEFRPTGRRRITGDPYTARDLAAAIVDFIWEYDPDADRHSSPQPHTGSERHV